MEWGEKTEQRARGEDGRTVDAQRANRTRNAETRKPEDRKRRTPETGPRSSLQEAPRPRRASLTLMTATAERASVDPGSCNRLRRYGSKGGTEARWDASGRAIPLLGQLTPKEE